MADPRSVLEREMQRVQLFPLTIDDFHARRNRKRRNQRITAGVVGIALFVAPVALIAVMNSRDRTPTPVGRSDSAVPKVDYVIDLNTGVMTPLPEAIIRSLGGGPLFETQYAASPDGSMLAYIGARGGGGEGQIFIAGIDGTGVRQVTPDPDIAGRRRNPGNADSSPVWSPDGTRIAYEGFGSGDAHRLSVVDVASGESTTISVVNRIMPLEPQFTPDGSSLLYTGGTESQPVIRTVPVTGGKSTLLIGPGGGLTGAWNGSLSPDGSLVTFLGSQIGRPGPERWVANADGTERRLLPDVHGIPCMSNPAGTWSPDGSRIVCGEASSVIVIDVETGDASPVAQGRGAIWLDDHTLLVSV
jgi:Tol biopolymer transport system component